MQGLEEYELRRMKACNVYAPPSVSEEEERLRELALTRSAHEKTREEVRRMLHCYNTSHLDRSFAEAPVDALGCGGRCDPVSQTLSEPTCHRAIGNLTLEQGVFDCTSLPECKIRCYDLSDEYGNDMSSLYVYSRTAMCTAQWWVHAFVLRTVFSVVIWISINFFRVTLLAGLVRICWEWLNTGNFTYLATCKADGAHTYKDADLADRVGEMLSRVRLTGIALVLVAFCSQIPWILAMRHFVSGLVYGSLS